MSKLVGGDTQPAARERRDLVERLRQAAGCAEDLSYYDLLDQAADRIEELESQVERLRGALEKEQERAEKAEAQLFEHYQAAEGQEPAYIGSTDSYHTGEGPSEGSVDVVESRPRLTIGRASEGQCRHDGTSFPDGNYMVCGDCNEKLYALDPSAASDRLFP